MAKFCPTTGSLYEHIKDAPDCQEILEVYRTGLKFSTRPGRRRGEFSRFVLQSVIEMGAPYTFERLLDKLKSSSLQRALYGEQASPVEEVNSGFELVTVHQRGQRDQLTFRAVRAHFTNAKKIINRFGT